MTNSTLNVKTGLYDGAMGGTEMQANGLLSRLPEKYLNDFQIICSRVRDIDPNKKQILWLHDLWNDPENKHLGDAEARQRFSKLVFVSYHQFQGYQLAYGIKYDESLVLKNCIDDIDPATMNKPDPNERVNLIYHTTPHRGLEILVPVFVELAKNDPTIHLDVFSSFDIYGWPARNEPYEHLFDVCKKHPQITYHGTQPNSVVREYLAKSHIFAYPSIWPETSCIAAIEALCSQNLIVCPDYAALPETIGDFGFMYRYDENLQNHANIFFHVLKNSIQLIKKDPSLKKSFTFQAERSMLKYGWKNRIPQWTSLLENLNGKSEA